MPLSNFFFILLILGSTLYVECYYLEDTPTSERRKACSTYVNIAQPNSRVETKERVDALRKAMRNETVLGDYPIDAYIVTSDDEHQTEFVSEHDARRKYISGFSGGRGDAIITQNKSALWVEGRYHLQADDQLDCHWLLMREGLDDVPTRTEWLKQELWPGARVGADPKLISEWLWKQIESELESFGLKLVELNENLIDIIWTTGRPNQRNSDVFVWDEVYAGENYNSKINRTRKELMKLGVDAMVVTALDEIAWLLNARGRDIPYHPYVRSYLIIDMFEIRMYVNKTQLLENKIMYHFSAEYGISRTSVIFRNYDDIWTDLPTLTQLWKKVLIPSNVSYSLGASHAIYNLVKEGKRFPHISPIIHLKAVKNSVEIEGMRNAHVRDAAALCIFFEYFETRFKEGDTITELDVVDVLRQIRFEQDISTGNSFRIIAAYGPHGALPHYEPAAATNSIIEANNTLVLDSGGQYRDGTTDVTRTIHMGKPSEDHIKAYTRVLMGHIQFASMIFPSTVTANTIDIEARAPLWEVGVDYLHETSHGIGSYLGARESPININYRNAFHHELLVPGYFLSNEPGLYREDEFGVRLENILQVVEKKDFSYTPNVTYLGFEDVTLVPYDYKLIDFSLLTKRHREWLQRYNEKIVERVGAELKRQRKMKAFDWMMENTLPLPSHAVSTRNNHIMSSIFFIMNSFYLLKLV